MKSRIHSPLLVCVLLGFSACSNTSPKLWPAEAPVPKKQADKIVDSSNSVTSLNSQVDILLVIANDSSMQDHGANLALNAGQFTAAILNTQFLDYHIGVINTMGYDQGVGPTWGGQLSGMPKFIDRTTTNPNLALQTNMNVGFSASDPVELFNVVRNALTPPLSTGFNAGFLRPNADLAVMLISDTDPENYNENADQFYSFLLNLKGGDPSKVMIYAAYDPDEACGGEGDPVLIKRLLALAQAHSGSFSLCETDFGTKLAAISTNIVNSIDRHMRLSRKPDPWTIKVTYGSQVIPNDPDIGWAYDPTTVSLIFGKHVVFDNTQPKGTAINVSYDAMNVQDGT